MLRCLAHYHTDPHHLLADVSEFGGYFTGVPAVAMLLREYTYLPPALVITLQQPKLNAFINAICVHEIEVKTEGRDKHTDIVEHVRCTTPSNHMIVVNAVQDSLSPLSILTKSKCTLFYTWLSPITIGCAYPALTLNKRALLARSTQYAL